MHAWKYYDNLKAIVLRLLGAWPSRRGKVVLGFVGTWQARTGAGAGAAKFKHLMM
jgi:hypothetical protein